MVLGSTFHSCDSQRHLVALMWHLLHSHLWIAENIVGERSNFAPFAQNKNFASAAIQSHRMVTIFFLELYLKCKLTLDLHPNPSDTGMLLPEI